MIFSENLIVAVKFAWWWSARRQRFFFSRPFQDGGRLLEMRHCSNWDSYLEIFQEKIEVKKPKKGGYDESRT